MSSGTQRLYALRTVIGPISHFNVQTLSRRRNSSLSRVNESDRSEERSEERRGVRRGEEGEERRGEERRGEERRGEERRGEERRGVRRGVRGGEE